MTNGTVKIIITDETGQTQPELNNTISKSGVGKSEKKQSSVLGDYAQHELFTLIRNQGVKAVNYTIGNIGNFTGDYKTQKNISAGLGIANSLKNYAMSGIAGAEIGGPPGGIVAVGVAMVSDTINVALEEKSAYTLNNKLNRELSQLRELSGLNPLLDGSRGSLS